MARRFRLHGRVPVEEEAQKVERGLSGSSREDHKEGSSAGTVEEGEIERLVLIGYSFGASVGCSVASTLDCVDAYAALSIPGGDCIPRQLLILISSF